MQAFLQFGRERSNDGSYKLWDRLPVVEAWDPARVPGVVAFHLGMERLQVSSFREFQGWEAANAARSLPAVVNLFTGMAPPEERRISCSCTCV